MKRRVLMVCLAASTVLGFSAGAASCAHHASRHRMRRHAQFERHVAQLCTDAALRSSAHRRAPNPPPRAE